jgi:hypothetical protein
VCRGRGRGSAGLLVVSPSRQTPRRESKEVTDVLWNESLIIQVDGPVLDVFANFAEDHVRRNRESGTSSQIPFTQATASVLTTTERIEKTREDPPNAACLTLLGAPDQPLTLTAVMSKTKNKKSARTSFSGRAVTRNRSNLCCHAAILSDLAHRSYYQTNARNQGLISENTRVNNLNPGLVPRRPP